MLTGATGGLGTFITHALAEQGVKLALMAYPGAELAELQAAVERKGAKVISFPYDVRNAAQRRDILDQVHRQFGEIDILINNAGIEFTSAYHDLTEENIRDIIAVNLEGPMILTRLVLPEMLRRGRGHIVNMASLAGKAGPAFQEPYAATKAGLIAFTSSLRGTYRPDGVSASVIVPGFVEAGIYAKLKARSGMAAPALLGTSSPETVARAVLRAIEQDLPEVIVNSVPVRPLLAFTALFPAAGEWLGGKVGANDFFRRVVQAQKQQ
ncbi:MAG: SDR family NAD(P)-dependent oxidoreductase [Verrucomicrobia bacterium]|nr:SDR family NAD(P)-dependent oxidoreductase [Verrucomicrobiota bacterium]